MSPAGQARAGLTRGGSSCLTRPGPGARVSPTMGPQGDRGPGDQGFGVLDAASV